MVGRMGGKRGDKCRAELLDAEMMETDEKGKDGKLDPFCQIPPKKYIFRRKLLRQRIASSDSAVIYFGFRGMAAL